MAPDCRKRGKKRYPTEKAANRGRMNLWGSDPKADLNDLHVYKCPVCHGFHVGHKSKYIEEKNDDGNTDKPKH